MRTLLLHFQQLRIGLPSSNVAVPALKMIHAKDVQVYWSPNIYSSPTATRSTTTCSTHADCRTIPRHHFLIRLTKQYRLSIKTYLTLQRGVTGRACIANMSPVLECWAVPACCTVLLIRLYLDNIRRKCNLTASCVFVKELALLWCGRQFLEIISSFFSLLSKSGFSFCSL